MLSRPDFHDPLTTSNRLSNADERHRAQEAFEPREEYNLLSTPDHIDDVDRFSAEATDGAG